MLPLIQVAEITGVYGVSFLVIWMSVSLTIALLALVWQPGQGVLREAMLPILAVVVAMVFGVGKLAAFPKVEDTLKVVLVQPGTPQTLLFDRSDEETNFKNLLALSEEALAERTDLLVWPEGALASLTPEHSEAIAKLVTKHKVTLVACADTRDVRNDYNSALLIGPDGAIADVYHKRRLVIFGEYVPPWLSMFKWVTPIDGAFTAGKDAVQFYMTDLDVQTSVLVCFEDTFPQEAREHVTVDTDFLLNLSDDGWFGDGAEPWQHAANAAFRAVENDVPIVRCTCTGLTCWFDACGRCGGILRASDSVYGAGFLRADIPLMPEDEPSRTVYNVHGDWFGWSCLGLSAFWCAAIVRLRR
jgi:apolipoprotein N-acyltransferase